MTLTNAGESNAGKKKGVSAGNAVNAYSKGGKSGLSSGSILALASGTLKHFTFLLLAIDDCYHGKKVDLENKIKTA